MSIKFSDFCELYINNYAKLHKKSWKLDEQRCRDYLIPEWNDRQLQEIRRSDVAALHARIGSEKPFVANRLREQISKMIELAILWEYLPDDHRNPTKGIKEFKERPREDILKPQELPRLAAAIEAEPDIYNRAAFWLILLLGRRKTEILSLKWENVDLNMGFVRIPETKSGKTVMIPVSAETVAVLRSIPRRNAYVIAGQGEGNRYTIQKAWDRIRTKAGLPTLRIHDLRRTAAAWMATDGTSLHIIGEVLGHASPQITANYSRLADQALRGALSQHGSKLGDFLKPSFALSTIEPIQNENQPEIAEEVPVLPLPKCEETPKRNKILLSVVDEYLVIGKILTSIREGGRVKKQFYRKIGSIIKVNNRELERVLRDLVEAGILKRYREPGSQARHWRYAIADEAKKPRDSQVSLA